MIFNNCKNPYDKASVDVIYPDRVSHPVWAKDAVIYELNVRQFSPEGSFNAVTADLKRLKELGVDIIWLMPVHPIGLKNRKGEMGSYYSVRDYRDVNPEFGTMDDFKAMVSTAHEHGMKVIIDWVPNHSAWDNSLAGAHPDWYVKNEDGSFASPFDWTDVIQFDYDNIELRQYMIGSLKFWMEETDIDGYRFDVAHMVPVDFWNDARLALNEVKEVFLLAEADQPLLHNKAMNMSYDWRFHHIMNEVAAGRQTVVDMKKHFAYTDTAYPPNSILMQFTSNHDENSWNGTAYDRLGAGLKAFAVLTFTVQGMPLIYNGQEACIDKMLKFFERDPIEWKECEMCGFYQKLIKLRTETPALWSTDAGGDMNIFSTGMDDKVFAFSRTKGESKVVALFNFSEETLNLKLPDDQEGKKLKEYFSGEIIEKITGLEVELNPWDYKVFLRN